MAAIADAGFSMGLVVVLSCVGMVVRLCSGCGRADADAEDEDDDADDERGRFSDDFERASTSFASS